MHLLGISDLLKCITSFLVFLAFFDAHFLGLVPENNFLC
jgi:hypothetical protein